MKRLLRIIIGIIPIAIGAVFIIASINTMSKGGVFFTWLSAGLFGISLVVAGIAILKGVRLQDIFQDYL